MATTDTSNTTSSSMLLTPQAVDDFYYLSEDDQSGIQTFAVMTNDLGGVAKTLWAATDGTEQDLDSSEITDLQSRDYATDVDLSELGARFWIEGGMLKYDAAGKLDYLAAGEVGYDHITYAIRMANGTLSVATVTIQITGVNDDVMIGVKDVTGAIVEDTDTAAGAGNPDTLQVDTGTIAFSDADISDTHVVTWAERMGNETHLGTFDAEKTTDTSNGTGGLATWSYSVANADIQYLGKDQQLSQTYTVTIDDGHGGAKTEDVTVTITGVNDDVVIGAGTVAGAVTEDASGTAQESVGGSLAFTDADLIDAHAASVTANGSGYYGSLIASVSDDSTGDGAGTVSWSYSVSNADIQALTSTDHIHQYYTISLTDNKGSTVTQVIDVTLNGASEPVTVITIPSVFTGTGDSNDNDSSATASSAQIINDGTSGNTLRGSSFNDVINGNNGADLIYGGAGADVLQGGNQNDTIYGGSGNDQIYGGENEDALYGGSGNDLIFGGNNVDTIVGGFGADTLTGGNNADTFSYIDLRDTGDTINAFVSGTDKIDLSAIDANGAAADDPAFAWGGTTATANGVWYATDSTTKVTTVYVDTDGNVGSAELVIYLAPNGTTAITPVQGDFIL